MEFTQIQGRAIKGVSDWAKSKTGPQVMRLFGYAGTGKTTIAKEIAANVKGTVLFGAFTGKASMVMRKKGCAGASTLHSLIYKIDEAAVGPEPKFILNPDSALRYAKLLIVDECSMVDEFLGSDLLKFKCKILVLGDPAQLMPVKGQGYFTAPDVQPDYMLEEVHRAAAESPIIRLSMDIRNGHRLQYGDYGNDCRIIRRDQLGQKMVMGADIVICGMNKTRITLNKRIRELKGITSTYPVEGDQIICLKNDHEIGLFNGGMFTCTEAQEPDQNGLVVLKVLSQDDPNLDYPIEVMVPEKFWLGREDELHWTEKQGVQQMFYGNAITCHKAQGSEWDNIVVFDEAAIFKRDAWRWRYTAITRAAERFTYIM